jgi:hypothetical protein
MPTRMDAKPGADAAEKDDGDALTKAIRDAAKEK